MAKPKGQVLFLATVYSHLAQFHIPFMNLLRSRGYTVHAAACMDGSHHVDRVVATGTTCWNIPFARSPYRPRNIIASLRLRELLAREHYDLIHVHTPVAAFLGRYLAKATRQGPVIYTAHGFHFFRGAPLKNWVVYYTAEKIAARWTDCLIVMNSEDHDLGQKLGFRPGRNLFHTHGVGVDVSKFSEHSSVNGDIRTDLCIDDDEPVVVCIGEVSTRKNQDFLLDGWALIGRKLDFGHLLLVGSGDRLETLSRRVERERIPRVHFLGYRKDVPQILAQADIVTLLSKHEGLPRCIMEAMSAGKSVVASNVRGNRDLVEHGTTGFLVDLGDTASLVSALEILMVNTDLRNSMGNAGKHKIKDYDLVSVVAELGEIYDRFLK
jgi:glycosyltransferase involved in cell wall biosynthesis